MVASLTEDTRQQDSPFFGFNRAVQATQKNNSQARLAAFIGQWEVLITLFKHTFEIPTCAGSLKDPNMHRTGLTQLMGMGETILTLIRPLDEEAVSETGYSKNFVESNLQYLRDKYEAHFFSYDAEQLEADRGKIWHELSAINK